MAALGGCIALASAFAFGAGGKAVNADEKSPPDDGEAVKIDKVNFPDTQFRSFIAESFDGNKDGLLDKKEIAAVTEMWIDTDQVRSAKGLEFFTALQRLDVHPEVYGMDTHGRLTEIDVSKNTELEWLVVSSNQLKSLDVSKNTKLWSLGCEYNEIKSLDLSHNPELRELFCSGNKITSLDVSLATEMTWLDCYDNALTSLDLTNNTKMVRLNVGNNPISDLKMGEMRDLDSFECVNCNLKGTLDVSGYPELEDLWCGYNNLTAIELGNINKLKLLDCCQNKIEKLDLSKLTDLYQLEASFNKLTSLDASNSRELLMYACAYNKITSIDISKNPNLKWILCYGNAIPEVDISNQADIIDLVENTERGISDDGLNYFYYRDEDLGDLGKDTQELTVEVYGYWLEYAMDTKITYKSSNPTPDPKKADIGDFVERLYTEALGRPSEKAGKKYWIDEIKNGRKTGADCGLFFLLGEEFTNRNLSVEDFVETLYKTFFGRESEPDGKAYWVGVLKNGGDRAAVIKGFIDSTEWCNLCADYGVRSGAPTAKAEKASKNATAFATRLYICCLGRDPEEKGLAYWALALTNLEQTGCSAAKEFFGSKEFADLNLSDEEFVTRLYTTFMDREPEESEVSYWTGEISKGTQTRASVLAFFGSSEEFTAICAGYGIERGTI